MTSILGGSFVRTPFGRRCNVSAAAFSPNPIVRTRSASRNSEMTRSVIAKASTVSSSIGCPFKDMMTEDGGTARWFSFTSSLVFFCTRMVFAILFMSEGKFCVTSRSIDKGSFAETIFCVASKPKLAIFHFGSGSNMSPLIEFSSISNCFLNPSSFSCASSPPFSARRSRSVLKLKPNTISSSPSSPPSSSSFAVI